MNEELWNAQQAADYLSLKLHTVRRMAHAGRIPGVKKICGEWRFEPERIREWVRQHNTCLVVVGPGVEVTATTGGDFYPPGAELPGGHTYDLGVYVGTRQGADDFVSRYGGLLITGSLA